ncbi:MAG TPA: hypothetical protein PKE63_00135 [Lacibacter sp.]|nr:hypothetical protein [Lacibacter sp.]
MAVNVVLVSSGQPSANPRLVKEAIALAMGGYNVTVIYCPLSPWADAYDAELFAARREIQWVRAGAHSVKQPLAFRLARLRQQFFTLVYRVAGNRFSAAVRSQVLFSQELQTTAVQYPAALYIGHNLGSLPAIFRAARTHRAKMAFDFEDFHRGEDLPGSLHSKRAKEIEDCYVPALTYSTAAAPLIADEYRKLYPGLNCHTINNCFPGTYSKKSLRQVSVVPLRLFWFSQFIGTGRGLETILAAMGKTGNASIQLTLLGNCTASVRENFLNLARQHGLKEGQLVFHEPVQEQALVAIAAQHHIGFAAEVPVTVNRNLCLTNKIFIYLLAGNAILFSRTAAQESFLKEYPGIGSLYDSSDPAILAQLLKNYLDHSQWLQQQREASLSLARKQFNWEQESQHLLRITNAVLDRA